MTMPSHHCPGCGAAQKPFARYPWYFCQICLRQAQDRSGRGLEFANASFSGGLVWRRAGEEDWQEAGNVRCLIAGRPVMVGEARFGGVVAEPVQDVPVGATPYNLVDLT